MWQLQMVAMDIRNTRAGSGILGAEIAIVISLPLVSHKRETGQGAGGIHNIEREKCGQDHNSPGQIFSRTGW
jgi:hypothetical protein